MVVTRSAIDPGAERESVNKRQSTPKIAENLERKKNRKKVKMTEEDEDLGRGQQGMFDETWDASDLHGMKPSREYQNNSVLEWEKEGTKSEEGSRPLVGKQKSCQLGPRRQKAEGNKIFNDFLTLQSTCKRISCCQPAQEVYCVD